MTYALLLSLDHLISSSKGSQSHQKNGRVLRTVAPQCQSREKKSTFHHINQKQCSKYKIKVQNGRVLDHEDNPTCLGVTLKRTLTYCPPIESLRRKLTCQLSRKLATKSSANCKTLTSAALALCYSTTEFYAHVLGGSTHAKKIDHKLKEAWLIITGPLHLFPRSYLYRFCGIAPPAIQIETIKKIEKKKKRKY